MESYLWPNVMTFDLRYNHLHWWICLKIEKRFRDGHFEPVDFFPWAAVIMTRSDLGEMCNMRPYLSNEKNLGWLGYIGDYTTQLYRDYNEDPY